MSTESLSATGVLTSEAPDGFFDTLKTVRVSPTAMTSLTLTVAGWTRIARSNTDSNSTFLLGPVYIFTSSSTIPYVLLDGTALSIIPAELAANATAAIRASALGLPVGTSGRRLQVATTVSTSGTSTSSTASNGYYIVPGSPITSMSSGISAMIVVNSVLWVGWAADSRLASYSVANGAYAWTQYSGISSTTAGVVASVAALEASASGSEIYFGGTFSSPYQNIAVLDVATKTYKAITCGGSTTGVGGPVSAILT
jgi:hypothetical protein